MVKKWNNSQVQFPSYLGFNYDSEKFVWQFLQSNQSWSWKINEQMVAKINAAGGYVRELEGEMGDKGKTFKTNGWTQNHFRTELMGLEILIPDNTEIDEQLEINIDLCATKPIALTILIHLGENSHLNFKNKIHFNGKFSNLSLCVNGALATGSGLDYTLVEDSPNLVKQTLIGDIQCQRDAHCNWNLFPEVHGDLLGDLRIYLAKPGSGGEINLGCYGQPNDWIGVQGMIEHDAPDTFSRINMRSVLYKNSRVNFTSIGKINHGAHGANTDQESRIMTIEEAKGSVNPALIIDENDVKAGHAASVSQYDEDELYYLLSRGLSTVVAKQILIDNFMNPILKKMN